MITAAWMVIAGGLVATGCAADPVEIARLRYERGAPKIIVPASGAIAEPLEIVVHTEAGACDEQASTDVERTNDGVIITPYVRPETGNCILLLVYMESRATVSFDEAGEHQVVIRGRAGGNIVDLPYTITIE